MEDVQNLISLYHMGFLICAGIAALSFIIAVIMFIRFNIPKIISDKTGRGLRKSVRMVEERNAKTGTLRALNMTGRIGGKAVFPSAQNSHDEGQSRIVPPPARTADVQGTDVLMHNENEIQMTGGGIDSLSQAQIKENLPAGFRVTRRILIIHTNETLEV